ncbi:MAG: ATP-binding cassette domain-containing protein [Beijerinckiaceae bacterium]|nr:ATP-binding cassette domain-containing protein [Beijerinckiaceae bacterium]
MPGALPAPDQGCVAAWRGVTVRYPHQPRDAVGPVTLDLAPGEHLLLLGPSGAGKSTLLDTLTGLVPNVIPAALDGGITALGSDPASRTPAGWSRDIARHFQDADQTLCGMRVEDEIAFALENQGLDPGAIQERVAAAMRQVGINAAWRERRTTTLSGGERQLVALAATLAQASRVLLVDEPTSHLAPLAAGRLHHLLMTRAPGRSVLIVDHRLDGLITAIDRVAVLGRDGRIMVEGQPAALFRSHAAELDAAGVWRPLASQIDTALAAMGVAPPRPPANIADVMTHLTALDRTGQTRARQALEPLVAAALPSGPGPEPGARTVAARLCGADCAPFLGPVVLRNVDLTIMRGEILGILGANGAGKSTLGLSLAGLLRLKAGSRDGAAGGVAFQNPESQFVSGSVREEVEAALAAPGSKARPGAVETVLAGWGLGHAASQHPFELSHGQKRRLALATLTAGGRWPLLVLDEPMAGLDAASAASLAARIEALAAEGHAIALITHDMDLALRLCRRSVVVGEGGIMADAATTDVMADPALLARAGLAPPVFKPVLDWFGEAAP